MAAAAVESTMDTSDGDAAATSGLTSYFTSKIGGLERDVRRKALNLQRLTAQRNSLNARSPSTAGGAPRVARAGLLRRRSGQGHEPDQNS